MVNISFFLDRSDHKYSPGDVINLEARVQVNTIKTFRSIYATIEGYAHVEWTESRQFERDGKSDIEHMKYHSNESLFQRYLTLAGTRTGRKIQLEPGLHVYHARFELPRNVPENHENIYGHIRYEAKVLMDDPWGCDAKESTSFYLIPRVDLNEFPHLREPVRAAARKTFGCCFWESDPLFIYNVLPRRAFVPGDRIQYSLELNNNSDVAIETATVKLVEKIIYLAHYPRSDTRENYRTLWWHEFSGNGRHLVSPMQKKVFTTEIYFNPSWDFHYFNGCKIITVGYYLKSKARISGCYLNLNNHTSITVGTTSSENCGTVLPSMAPMMPFPSASVSLPSAPPDEPISEQPLPSYYDTHSKPMAPRIGWIEGTSNLETSKTLC